MSIYGILIGIGIVIGIELIKKRNTSLTYLDIFIVLVAMLLGARVLFLLHNINEIRDGLINPFEVWKGGLAFFGGLIGLLASVYVISKSKKKNFFKYSDSIILFLPLIQSIGRIGNYFNYELYGRPTNLPWGIEIPQQYRDTRYIQYTHFHPTFIYESILNIFNFLLLVFLSKRTKKKGLITSIYLINYSLIRLFTNLMRIDKEYLLGIETSDIFSIFFLLTGILILSTIMKKKNILAKLFSRVLMILLVLLCSISILFKINIPLHYQLFFILFTFLLPIFSAILFKLFDITSDLSVNKREERPKLYLVFLLCFLASLYLSLRLDIPLLIEIYTILNLTFFLGLVITFFWKISFHMIFSVLTIFFTIYIWQIPYMYLLIFALPLIGWSRLQLRRHCIKQVIAGTILAIVCIVLVLTFFNFW